MSNFTPIIVDMYDYTFLYTFFQISVILVEETGVPGKNS
jgi:hypothetical protein